MIETLTEIQQRFLVDHFYSDSVILQFDPLVIKHKGLMGALGPNIGPLLENKLITVEQAVSSQTLTSITFTISKFSKELLRKQVPGLVAIKFAIMGRLTELYDILPEVPRDELEKFLEVKSNVIQERVFDLMNVEGAESEGNVRRIDIPS